MILETKRMRGFRAAGISRRNIHKFESPPKTVVTSTAIKISVFSDLRAFKCKANSSLQHQFKKGATPQLRKLLFTNTKKQKLRIATHRFTPIWQI